MKNGKRGARGGRPSGGGSGGGGPGEGVSAGGGGAAGERGDENKLIAERRAKLAALRGSLSGGAGGGSSGGGAFPNDFRRDALAGQLHASFGERSAEWLDANPTRVQVGGRLMFKRVMGKASFAKIGDRTGQLQLYLPQEALGDAYEAFKSWDVGDIIGASGVLFRTRTGELTVRADALRLLVKSLRPLPDKWHGLADTETRYRQRYVDLIVSETSRNVFRTRTRIVRYLRDFLDALDFLEVETPMMQPIPGGALARPFRTHHNALDLDMYLRIAPELYLKRLIVGGLERVYEINRNFRNEGLSTQHNPEFTMLELYLAYADYRDLMEWVEKAIRGLADTLNGSQLLTYQGRAYDLSKPFRRLTVEQAVIEYNPGIDPLSLRDLTYLRKRCEQLGVKVDSDAGPGRLQIELFEKTAESALLDPTFICAFPAEVSPLSRPNDADPFIADRFEFFLAGREIANGFSELNDPEEQAARFRAQAAAKDRGDEEAMFYDADYVRALEYGMPPAAGLGVGIDRLVMFFTDSPSIRDVILFPHMRPEAQ
ncbi:MAG TPA: lysine--tRNA ligase [Steroidobacteraceae bacterium]|nr:lysine--tRNA ligase [Steroidobacteraceae bacterium]